MGRKFTKREADVVVDGEKEQSRDTIDFSRQSGSGDWGGLIGHTPRPPIRWRQFTASSRQSNRPKCCKWQLETIHGAETLEESSYLYNDTTFTKGD